MRKNVCYSVNVYHFQALSSNDHLHHIYNEEYCFVHTIRKHCSNNVPSWRFFNLNKFQRKPFGSFILFSEEKTTGMQFLMWLLKHPLWLMKTPSLMTHLPLPLRKSLRKKLRSRTATATRLLRSPAKNIPSKFTLVFSSI